MTLREAQNEREGADSAPRLSPDDPMTRLFLRHAQCGCAGAGHIHAITARLEEDGNGALNGQLVIDQEDARWRRHTGLSSAAGSTRRAMVGSFRTESSWGEQTTFAPEPAGCQGISPAVPY